MKRRELEEMIKAAYLSEADFTNAQDDDAALGGMYDDLYEEDLDEMIANLDEEEESLDDILSRISGTSVDPYLAEADKEESAEEILARITGTAVDPYLAEAEGDEEEDVEVDAEEETTDGGEEKNDSIVVDKKIVSLSSLPNETRKILDSLETLRAQAEEFGDQKFITQVGNTITFFTRDFVVAGDEPTRAKVDESLEILRMKKLAGLLTEGEYAKALLRESKKGITKEMLSSKEQETVDYILGDNIEEAENYQDILSRLKRIAKKGLLTVAVLSSILGTVPAEAHSQIKDIARIEAGINVNTTQSQTDPIKQIQNVFKDVKVINTNPKNISKTDQPGSSLNWGANSGDKQASAGITVTYNQGSPFVRILITQSPGKSTDNYTQAVQQAKELGKVESSSDLSSSILVKTEKVGDVIKFLNNNVNSL